eukprot:Rhum_TRINITY_DN14889_c22_g1::Rhum_TRINITY_DN14889_c22_g1_i1::g.126492::m.126492
MRQTIPVQACSEAQPIRCASAAVSVSPPAPSSLHSSLESSSSSLTSLGSAPFADAEVAPPADKPAVAEATRQKYNCNTVVGTDAPCDHNSWDNVRVIKRQVTLRCRVCQVQWRTHVDAVWRKRKCGYFNTPAGCAIGPKCPKIHMHAKKLSLEERLLKQLKPVMEELPQETVQATSVASPASSSPVSPVSPTHASLSALLGTCCSTVASTSAPSEVSREESEEEDLSHLCLQTLDDEALRREGCGFLSPKTPNDLQLPFSILSTLASLDLQ